MSCELGAASSGILKTNPSLREGPVALALYSRSSSSPEHVGIRKSAADAVERSTAWVSIRCEETLASTAFELS